MKPTLRLTTAAERERALWVIACLILGAWVTVVGVRSIDAGLLACGIALGVSAVGLLLRQRWAKYVGLFSFGAFGLLCAARNPMSEGLALGLAAIVAAMILLSCQGLDFEDVDLGTDDADEEHEEMKSLVALLEEPCYLDAAILARLATDAWGVEVTVDDDEDEPYAVSGDSPHFLIRAEDRFFVVHHVDHPYFEEPEEFASQVIESRVCRAVLEHQAWISVDVVDMEGDAEDSEETYRMVARLLAELIDDNCLAICCPETGMIHPYQASFLDRLRSRDPLDALKEGTLSSVPVIQVDENDPRMKAAVETARRTWPEFISAFECRESDQTFSVKASLCDSSGCEQIWLTVTAVENDVIYGIVGNEPVSLKRYRLDDRARVACGDVSDWMYFDEGELHGGYTIEVLSRVAAERARRQGSDN